MRRRSPALLSAAVAVTLSVLPGLAPAAVRAADTPDGAVDALLDAIVEKRWDQLGPLVCEERRDEVVSQYDLGQQLGGDDMDVQPLIDSITFTIDDRSVTVLSEDGDTASVELVGTLRATIDEELAREWMRALLEEFGQPSDDATIDQFLGEMTADMAEGEDLASVVEVIREDGQWLVCDDLEGDDPDETFDPGATMAPVEDALCDLMTVEEANAATGLAFVQTTPYSGGCSWDSDIMSEDYYSVSIYLEDGELEFIRDIWEGEDVTIAGMPAWATENGTWIDIGDGLLTIMPWLLGDDAQTNVDPVELARQIGEIVVPRLP